MPKGYMKSKTSVHFMHYHFVWCPKYRKPVLYGKVKTRLIELINEKLSDLECSILKLSISKDHVHLFLTAHPKIAPNSIVGQVKGYTSRMLRREFPRIKSRLPTLWTRSYFVSTHGHVSKETIEKYIEEQSEV